MAPYRGIDTYFVTGILKFAGACLAHSSGGLVVRGELALRARTFHAVTKEWGLKRLYELLAVATGETGAGATAEARSVGISRARHTALYALAYKILQSGNTQRDQGQMYIAQQLFTWLEQEVSRFVLL